MKKIIDRISIAISIRITSYRFHRACRQLAKKVGKLDPYFAD